jgi:TolB-like protein/tetratricopeptide (TPR) repeat protein
VSDVFISYQRSTEKTARRVAACLREAGHAVWLDADLPPHRTYADIIREQLESARAVVVLWSTAAAQSEWVRAEADYARQQHKLVQVSLDGSLPPMPFNQIQCADLRGWTGDAADPEWRKIVGAIVQLAGGEPASIPAAPQASRLRRRRPWLGIGAAIAGGILVLALVGWFMRDRVSWFAPSGPVRIAILPFRVDSPSSGTKDFADGLADQIQSALNLKQLQVVSGTDAASLTGAARDAKLSELKVRLLIDGAVQDDGKTTSVDAQLTDTANNVVLWSERFGGLSNQPKALQAHVGEVIVGVLSCSAQALRPRDGLSDPQVLIQYLLACDRFAQNGEDNLQTMDQILSAMRQVTGQAPTFAPGHSALAKYLAYHASALPPDQAAADRAEASAEAQKALALDPKDADAYVALALLQPLNQWGQREALLRKGLAADPDWPHANGFLAQLLSDLGRVDEALTYSRKAAAVDPLGESWAGYNAALLASAGQTQEADADATQLATSWPDSTEDWINRMSVAEDGREWDRVMTSLAEPLASAALPKVDLDSLRIYAIAAKSRAPDAVAKAHANLLEMAKLSPANLTASISGLAWLGFVDDAFKLADQYQPSSILAGITPGFLFATPTASMRRDPRFMPLVSRLGLVNYWRASGKWPDFCRDPALPYRCA